MGGAAHLRVIIIASLAGLLFGFDTAVIAGVTGALREGFALTPAGLGATVSSALWGTLLGALVLGRPRDRFGSRNVLRVIGALYVVSAVGCALAWSLPSFVFWRFLAGLAIGGSSVLAPVYLAEIAPAGRRGALVGLFQMNIVVGILLAYGSNFCVARLIGGGDVWRYKLAIAALPALFRETVVLRDILGLSYRASAEVTGAPTGAVAWRLAEGRRDFLHGHFDFDRSQGAVSHQ